MPLFRKKPVVISAEQYNGPKCVPSRGIIPPAPDGVEWDMLDPLLAPTLDYYPVISTLEGRMIVSPGDWIITGIAGERYPCRADIFAATYEPIDDTNNQ